LLRIAVITYRKRVKDSWPQTEFAEFEVPVPGGGQTKMKLASRKTPLTSGEASIPVLEVRRLTETGHPTAIITTAVMLESPVVAGRMFSRWCQENFFAYMMHPYDIDGLVQYGSEEIPGTSLVVNPARRSLEKQISEKVREVRKRQAKLGMASLLNVAADIHWRSEQLKSIQELQADLDERRAQRAATDSPNMPCHFPAGSGHLHLQPAGILPHARHPSAGVPPRRPPAPAHHDQPDRQALHPRPMAGQPKRVNEGVARTLTMLPTMKVIDFGLNTLERLGAMQELRNNIWGQEGFVNGSGQ
jgi:hypothetical protein